MPYKATIICPAHAPQAKKIYVQSLTIVVTHSRGSPVHAQQRIRKISSLLPLIYQLSGYKDA